MQTTYRISEVSQRVGLSQKRIRDYEKNGLIKPVREPKTNNRRYTAADIQQIQRLKELIHEHGFTLACLRHFLAAAPCWAVFNCPDKAHCPMGRTAFTPCYEIADRAPCQGAGHRCRACPVYLNRQVPRITLFKKP